MSNQQLTIECSQSIKNILCEALLNYAQFSSQYSRVSLSSDETKQILALVEDINRQHNSAGQIHLHINHRDHCARAIQYHYDRIYYLLNSNVDQQRVLMLNLLHGEPAGDADLDRALQLDQVV